MVPARAHNMCYGYISISLVAAAAALYLTYSALYIKPKPVQDQDEDEDKLDGPTRNLRTRPLVPAVDLSTYTYM